MLKVANKFQFQGSRERKGLKNMRLELLNYGWPGSLKLLVLEKSK